MAGPSNRDISVRLRVLDDGSVVLANFGRQTGRTAAKAERNFARVEAASRRSAGAVQQFAASMGLLGGVTGAAIGIAAVVLPIVKAAQVTDRLQVALAGVRAVSGATADQMAELEEQARSLGATTQFSASQAAEAQEFLAKAGFEVNEVLGATPATLDLAAAGMLDLGRAADISSNILQAFEGDAEELQNIVDIMAATASNANTSVSQMGKAMEFVAPVANSFGVSIEETAAGIAVLSNAGFQAEKAGTGLRRVLVDLANPSGKLAAVMGELSVESDGLVAVMERVANSTLSAQDAMDIFGQRGGPAFNILRAGAASGREFAEMLQDVDGVARRIAETRLDNLSGDARKLGSALAELGIQVGENELIEDLRDLTQALTEFARGDAAAAIASNLFPALKSIFGLLASLVAARFGSRIFGALATSAATATGSLNLLATQLGTARGRFVVAGRAARIFGATLAALGGPVGLAILAGIGIFKLITRETELAKASEAAAEAQKTLNDELKTSRTASLDAVLTAAQAQRALVEELENATRNLQGETIPDRFLPQETVDRLEEARQKLAELEEQVSNTFPDLQAFGGAGPVIANAYGTVTDQVEGTESAMDRLEAATKRLGDQQSNAVNDARAFAAAQRDILQAQFEARAPDLDEDERLRQREELNNELARLQREQFDEERRLATKAASERLFLLKSNISDEQQLRRGQLAIRRDLAEEELDIERRKFQAIQQELLDSLAEEQRLREQSASAFDIADELERQARNAGKSQRALIDDAALEAMRASGQEAIELWQEFARLGGDAFRAARNIRQEAKGLEEEAEAAGENTKTLADEFKSVQQAIMDTEESLRQLTKERDLNTKVKVDDSEFREFLRRLAGGADFDVQVTPKGGPGQGNTQNRRLGGPILKAATGRRVPGGYGGGDKVRAMLEPGEYVVRKEAVRHYGGDLLAALNSMRLPPPIYRAGGGPAGEVLRRTSLRTPERDQVDVNLDLGGERFRLSGERETARALAKTLRGLSSSVPGGVG